MLLGLGSQVPASQHLTTLPPLHSQGPAAMTVAHTQQPTELSQATAPHLERSENSTVAKIQLTYSSCSTTTYGTHTDIFKVMHASFPLSYHLQVADSKQISSCN